ncbi:hypothetical protein [Pseudonocardia hydrocarbonoxydans]|uniref:Uncharacterized protein n=1 Tax=Pseudonocardia hydrocarbonoxydans TaxID=76726 RepID=A0A4Y3WMZ8_9PSEU|nr:hypothetical protein [Pseudonocardia hydrocarbonoxydans]GEC19868.1 hypothetical protein PHY01_21510 [Pseudonocardia hydrocarbonoxydans]
MSTTPRTLGLLLAVAVTGAALAGCDASAYEDPYYTESSSEGGDVQFYPGGTITDTGDGLIVSGTDGTSFSSG